MKKVGEGSVRVSTLEFPFELYPRNKRDEEHVERLAVALKAGETLPPIIVEEKSLRVADGWHRSAAHERVYGHDSEIPAEFWTYKSDEFFFIHATRLNTMHGLKLSSHDEVRCLTIAKNFQIGSDKIRRVLAITPERAKELMENGWEGRKQATPIPNGLQYLGRRTLSKDQLAVLGKLSGKPPSHHARELLLMLEHDLMPDPSPTTLLGRLKTVLEAKGY